MKPAKYLLLLAAILLATSCRTSRRAQEQAQKPETGLVQEGETRIDNIVKKNQALRFNEGSITSKINLVLGSGEKTMSVGGNLRMKRNDVIQLSLVAFGILEAGRMELTKDYILILDRMGRKYIRVAYSDLDILTKAGVDFYTFQSLFWGEVFLLGENAGQPKYQQFEKSEQSGMVCLSNSESEHIALSFLMDAASQMLRHTMVSSKKNPEKPLLNWQYLSYTTLDKKEFPSKMQFSFTLSKTPVTATLTLNNPKKNTDWETRTEVNTNRFKEVSLTEVLSMIMKLSQ